MKYLSKFLILWLAASSAGCASDAQRAADRKSVV